ncbi:MAG: diguanylate cyclase [Ilumatobacteraceae bacterium]
MVHVPTRQMGEERLAAASSWQMLTWMFARTIGTLAVAYLLARWTIDDFVDDTIPSGSTLAIQTIVHVAFAAVGLYLTTGGPLRRDLLALRREIQTGLAEAEERDAGQQLLRDFQSAAEMAENESELLDVTELALAQVTIGRTELLVADASRAHLIRAAVAEGREAPGCSVETPASCPAVRRGRTLKFGDPAAVAACPRLRERTFDEPTVATCIPVTILGTPTAVLHSTCTADLSPKDLARGVRRLEGVAVQIGARLGMLRAMSKSQLQADTDPLTGLLNRRAMEDQVRELRLLRTPFAVAMADLDHFKRLNDTYGHDTGDRALRTFARVLREAVRDSDIIARHGGEEFVIVLPRSDVVTAAPVVHRIRDELQAVVDTGLIPAFTVSIGMVDSSWSDDFVELVRGADRALLDAKQQGRDRLVIGDPPASADRQPATALD